MTDHDTLPDQEAADPRRGTAATGEVTSGGGTFEEDLHPEDGPGEATPSEEDSTEETEGKPRRSFWKELPFLIVIALVVAVLIKTFLVQAFWIPSGSMEETLQVNDRVLVNKLAYRFGDPARGDVIVFDDPRGETNSESILQAIGRNLLESVGLSTPKSEYIKRVVGLPGETVQVRGGDVEIDGVPLDEPWLHPFTRMPDFGPETIGDDQLFVMGDNRNASQDSRVFGAVDRDTVVGKAFVVLWPPSRWSGL